MNPLFFFRLQWLSGYSSNRQQIIYCDKYRYRSIWKKNIVIIIFAILSSPGWNAGEGLLRSIDFVISTVQEYSLFQLSPTFLLVLFILSNLHLILSFPLTPFLSVGPLSCDRCRMVSLLGGLKTGQGTHESILVCVCDIKCVTPLVCQRELASIFLNVLCIAVSDLSALTADRLDTFRTKKSGKREKGGRGNAVSGIPQ